MGRRRAEKGECRLRFEDIAQHAEGLLAGVECKLQNANCKMQNDHLQNNFQFAIFNLQSSLLSPLLYSLSTLHSYREVFSDRCYLLAELHHGPDDRQELERMMELARRVRLPLAAAGDVHYHVPERQALCDVMTAIRHGCTVAAAGEHLFANAERHLKPPEEMAALFAAAPSRSATRWRSPSTAPFRSTSCATSIPKSWLRRAKP